MLYWFLKKVLVGPLVKVLFRPEVEGAENIPERGPAIFASNHLSFIDSVFIPLVVPRRMTFPAKSDYFTGTGIKGWAMRTFFTGVGQIPMDRSGGEASKAALRSSLKVLKRGEFLGIYPEGTRSPDGRLYKGKTGVARMALEAHAPVIPVGVIGTDKAQPTGQMIPRVAPVTIRFGKPLDFSRYDGMQDDRYVLRAITDEIMYEIMKLSGQEYVDEYAATVKQRIAARAKEAAGQARAALEQAREQARVTVEQTRGQVEQAAAQVAEQVREQVEQVREQMEQAREQRRAAREEADTQEAAEAAAEAEAAVAGGATEGTGPQPASGEEPGDRQPAPTAPPTMGA
ncbi:MAG TPA: 1-acyl-sn-glycerol-3-phosphate acyltransferase [Ornithinicoccus sp.]|nr:1-acyl-sn-glycerol-3-phosphate acyltransferase [Ornithinicoccus sp.]